MTVFPCTIAFDFQKMKPGCALIQAGLGATIGNDALSRWEPGTWLTSPTDGMRLVTLFSENELDRAVALTKEVHG